MSMYVCMYVCDYNTGKIAHDNEIFIRAIYLKFFNIENKAFLSLIFKWVIILWDLHLFLIH